MVRLPLMLRESLESEANVPGDGSELRGHVDHAKLIEQQKERTRVDSVVGIRALSADDDDRSTRRRRGRRRRRCRADSYRDEIRTTYAMSIGGRTLPTLLQLVAPQTAVLFTRLQTTPGGKPLIPRH